MSIDKAVPNADHILIINNIAQGIGTYFLQTKLGLPAFEPPVTVCGRYIRMQCTATLRQTQLASSTRGRARVVTRGRRFNGLPGGAWLPESRLLGWRRRRRPAPMEAGRT
jgi:hypothetical protein